MNYYEVLEVSPNASQEIIKIAYKNLAKKYHPDTSNSEISTKKMQEINEAYDILKDLQKRNEYDEYLRSRQSYNVKHKQKSTVENITNILSKVSRMYPEIVSDEHFRYSSKTDISYSLRYNECGKYIRIPQGVEIYVYYYDTLSTSEGKQHTVMAITDVGIIAFSENYDTKQKIILWEDFKRKIIKTTSSGINIGDYFFRTAHSQDLIAILKEIQQQITDGYHEESADEERTNIVIKKIKHEIGAIIFCVGLTVLCYYKGWNNWIVKYLDICTIGYTCNFIGNIFALYIKNDIFKKIVKAIFFIIGAIIWYKITR